MFKNLAIGQSIGINVQGAFLTGTISDIDTEDGFIELAGNDGKPLYRIAKAHIGAIYFVKSVGA